MPPPPGAGGAVAFNSSSSVIPVSDGGAGSLSSYPTGSSSGAETFLHALLHSFFVALSDTPGNGTDGGNNGGHSGGGGGHYPERWSSLIGIVTAIIGNVLISFALNTQRYAHIRLSREQADCNAKARERKKKLRKEEEERQIHNGNGNGNGASTGTAEARDGGGARTANGIQQQDEDMEEATETDMLLPRRSSRGRNRRGPWRRWRMRRVQEDDENDEEANREADEDAKAEEKRNKNYLQSPYWWTGIVLMVIGEAGNFLAYGFAPASIVSPLGVVGLISNCIIAPFLFKEPFRRRDFFGVVIAVAGAVTVVLSASSNNPKLGPDEIWHLITRWEFETYLGITIACIIGLMAASATYGQRSVFVDIGLVGLFGMHFDLSTSSLFDC